VIDWRRDVPRALVTAGAAGVLAGAASPWAASGAAERTSFQMAGLVDRLGFAPSGAVGVAVRAWPLVPLCVVAATVLVWWGRGLAAAVLAGAGGAYAAAVSASVWRAPDAGLVRVLEGPARTLAGAIVLLAGAVVTGALARPTRRDLAARPSASTAGRS
jgi:hypothetical protein